MKNLFIILLLGGFIFLIQSGCSKTDTSSAESDCSPQFPDQNVTYTNYVSTIISTHCTNSCHNGSGAAPGDFRTYEGVFAYTGQFFFRVIQDRADMPQGNAPLPKPIRDSLNIWIKNCSPR